MMTADPMKNLIPAQLHQSLGSMEVAASCVSACRVIYRTLPIMHYSHSSYALSYGCGCSADVASAREEVLRQSFCDKAVLYARANTASV